MKIRALVASGVLLLACSGGDSEGDGSSKPGAGSEDESSPSDEAEGSDDADDGNEANAGPIAGSACLRAALAAERCYASGLNSVVADRLASYSEACDEGYAATPEDRRADVAACYECLAETFTDCPTGRYRVHERVLACETCGGARWDINEVLPRSAYAATCEYPQIEVCDGEDNDCDGDVDEFGVCPDDTVSNTSSFSDGITLRGTTQPGSCWLDGMLGIWPALDSEPYGPFECTIPAFMFTLEGQLLYSDDGRIHDATDYETGMFPVVFDAAPCSYLRSAFGLDAAGNFVHSCGLKPTGLYRNGEKLVEGFEGTVLGVLSDGRIVATSPGDVLGDWETPYYSKDIVLLDPDGRELSRLSPHTDFGDQLLTPIESRPTIRGDKATVAFHRPIETSFDAEVVPEEYEIVVYNLVSDDRWELVRRLRGPFPRPNQVVPVADGKIFIADIGSATTTPRVDVYLEDGTMQNLWMDGDSSLWEHGNLELYVMP